MTEEVNKYICVVCGNKVDALYRQYGVSVIKVTNCHRCGSISDKYIEYDPVIIMVDLILLSKEAYRHVLYNTSFKAYWKLIIVLIALETYIEWSNHTYLESQTHLDCSYAVENSAVPSSSEASQFDSHCKNTGGKIVCQNKTKCTSNIDQKKFLESDPFLTEKGVYITFFCVCLGVLVYSAAVFVLSVFSKPSFIQSGRVNFIRLVKGLTLGGMGNLLMLPAIIWGGEHETSIHSPLVLTYTTLALVYIHAVLFECSKATSFLILATAFLIKISVRAQLKSLAMYLMET